MRTLLPSTFGGADSGSGHVHPLAAELARAYDWIAALAERAGNEEGRAGVLEHERNRLLARCDYLERDRDEGDDENMRLSRELEHAKADAKIATALLI